MYPDSGYKLAHAQSVCTRPFSPRREGLGDEASLAPYPLGGHGLKAHGIPMETMLSKRVQTTRLKFMA